MTSETQNKMNVIKTLNPVVLINRPENTIQVHTCSVVIVGLLDRRVSLLDSL